MKTILTTLLLLTGTFLFSQNASEKAAKNNIENIRAKLLSGSVTFATAARMYSEDIDSAKKGGLWEIEKTTGDKDLDKAIARLKPNEISDPIKTRGAYHLVEVLENNAGKIKLLHILITFAEEED